MTIITDPAASRVQAIFLKMHCGLFSMGMKHSQMTGKELLAKVTAVTNKPYKRGQYVQARQDLIDWMAAYDKQD